MTPLIHDGAWHARTQILLVLHATTAPNCMFICMECSIFQEISNQNLFMQDLHVYQVGSYDCSGSDTHVRQGLDCLPFAPELHHQEHYRHCLEYGEDMVQVHQPPQMLQQDHIPKHAYRQQSNMCTSASTSSPNRHGQAIDEKLFSSNT